MGDYKVEIKTDVGTYDVVVPAADAHAAWLIVEDTLNTHMPFESGDEVLAIGTGAVIKHVVIKKHEAAPVIEAAEETPEVVEGVFDWVKYLDYLGNPLVIKGVGYKGPGIKTAIMPVQANRVPITEVIGVDKLNHLLAEVFEKEGNSPGTYHIMYLPDMLNIAPEDAGSWLIETVGPGATGYRTDKKTATAFHDWRG